jgi:hypothetical protein
MSANELLESVTFTDALGLHTITLEKVDVRRWDTKSTVPAVVDAWLYVVTEHHSYTYTETNEELKVSIVGQTQKTKRAEFLDVEKAQSYFTHIYREQTNKETLKGVENFTAKAIGISGENVSVKLTGEFAPKTIVMTLRAFRSLRNLASDLEKFDVEFLYYTNTSIADDVIVIGPATNN